MSVWKEYVKPVISRLFLISINRKGAKYFVQENVLGMQPSLRKDTKCEWGLSHQEKLGTTTTQRRPDLVLVKSLFLRKGLFLGTKGGILEVMKFWLRESQAFLYIENGKNQSRSATRISAFYVYRESLSMFITAQNLLRRLFVNVTCISHKRRKLTQNFGTSIMDAPYA